MSGVKMCKQEVVYLGVTFQGNLSFMAMTPIERA